MEEFLLGERMRLRRKREVADAASNAAQLAAATALVAAAPDAAAGAFPLKTFKLRHLFFDFENFKTFDICSSTWLALFIVPKSSEPRCFRASPDALCGCSALSSKRPSAAVDAFRGPKWPVQSRDLRIVLTLQARQAAGSARRCLLRGRHSLSAARRRSRSGSWLPPAAARRSWRGWGCSRLGQNRCQSTELTIRIPSTVTDATTNGACNVCRGWGCFRWARARCRTSPQIDQLRTCHIRTVLQGHPTP